jgi:hypothetical protein
MWSEKRTEPTPVTGGCLCGRVRYQAEVFLQHGYICHCTVCQRSAGQPAEIAVLIRAGTLNYLGDEPKYYVSSADGKRGFCADCGSRIVWQALRAQDDWLTNLSVGSLDRPQDVRVTRHTCADTQLPWFRLRDDLPKFTAAENDDVNALFRRDVTSDG